MSRMQNGFQALYPKKPESPNQSQYRGVNSNSTGGARGTPSLRRSDVPSWSLSGGISPATASAGQDFSRAAQSPPVDTGKIISDRITANMNNATAQGRQMANSAVDGRLNARMGYYSAPQARQSGFFQRGMGPVAGDAAIAQRQSQPLGDGGPAAAAARANQSQRRMDAEAMMGPSQDGLARYAVDPRLLQFANQGRMAQDSAMSSATGGGSVYRQPMQAMTPSEIQFYRHKMNMASNPQYAQRVLQERMDRQGMLGNQRLMANARRAGALEAAGASQQLRNLQAGRGALSGQAGFGALMGAAAQQNPNEAFGNFGQAATAQNAPGMLQDRLIAEENMLATRAQLGRMQQYEDMRMQIIGSGMPEIEKQRALQSLNNSIISSGFGGNANPAQAGSMDSVTSSGGSVNGIPNWLPLPEAFPDETTPTVNRMAEYKKGLMTNPRWLQLPPEQQSQILSQIESQYFPGIRQSDRQQHMQDNALNPLSRLFNAGMGAIGMDAASQSRRQESLDAINPYRAGTAPYREGQVRLTPDQIQAVEQMPDSRDRQMYERLLRQGFPNNNPRLGMWDAWKQLLGLEQ